MEVVILAAGQGTRMYSSKPKVLHGIGGRPMLSHVLDAAHRLQPDAVHVVIGYGAEEIRSRYGASTSPAINWVMQPQQQGTGHAVRQAVPHIDTSSDQNQVLVLFADVPLISPSTLESLLRQAGDDTLSLLTVITDNPAGLGRVIRDKTGDVQAIVEERDASAEQRQIKEVNTGVMAAPAARLARWLGNLDNDNDQGEYYLTDIVAMAARDGCRITAVRSGSEMEVMGANDKRQLALLERHYQSAKIEALLREGVTMKDPARVDIRGELTCGRDVEIDVNVIFEGDVNLGNDVTIGSNVIIRQSRIGDGTQILPGSLVDEAEIGAGTAIGPMARIRPGTALGPYVKVGNFVEIKQSTLGEGTKANHLAYIGDAEIGRNCNIGAGTIFCNYDGADKHRTTVGDGVFIGSNSTLIAPVTLNDGAFIAAGSTINTDVPAGNLGVARGKQRNITGWKRPTKEDGE